MEMRERLAFIHEQMREASQKAGRNVADITLIGVTKTVPVEQINEAINSGLTCIGENRVQELLSKIDELEPVERHLIGSLQSNKVKAVVDEVSLIHSLDRVHLAEKLNESGLQRNKPVNVLIQVNIGHEDTKTGVLPEDFFPLLQSLQAFPMISVKGLMCIPPPCEGSEVKRYFEQTYELAQQATKRQYDHMQFSILSMGMSHDFMEAIECGATHIRVGRALFGERN